MNAKFLNPQPKEISLLAAGYRVRFPAGKVTSVPFDLYQRLKKMNRTEAAGLIELNDDIVKDNSKLTPLVNDSLKRFVKEKLNVAIRGWEMRFAEQIHANFKKEESPEYDELIELKEWVLKLLKLTDEEKKVLLPDPVQFTAGLFKEVESTEDTFDTSKVETAVKNIAQFRKPKKEKANIAELAEQIDSAVEPEIVASTTNGDVA